MLRILGSRSCPPEEKKPDLKELKKNAKHLPAFEAYRGVVTRVLGLHHWLAHNYRDAAISLVGILLVATGILVTNLGILDPHHEHFCCYPPNAPRGTLGSCKDPKATIHDHPDKQTCTGNGPQFWVITVAYISVALWLYYFADESKQRFLQKCEIQWESLKKEIVTPIGLPPDEVYKSQKKDIIRWQNKHWGIRILAFTPEAFFFGIHFKTFGKTTLYFVYNLAFWIGAIGALTFFTVAIPLDKAWR